jgi:hypothetical protein
MRQTALIMASFMVASLIGLPAQASQIPRDVQAQLSAPGKIGQVQVRFLGIRIYSAALFTEQGAPFKWSRPFALELKYARSFSRDRLVSASISELVRVEGKRGDHEAIATKLNSCFRDVKARDRFVAVPKGSNGLSFFLNGRQTCRINHSNIRSRVLGIWLADNSRDRGLSRRLRGLN